MAIDCCETDACSALDRSIRAIGEAESGARCLRLLLRLARTNAKQALLEGATLNLIISQTKAAKNAHSKKVRRSFLLRDANDFCALFNKQTNAKSRNCNNATINYCVATFVRRNFLRFVAAFCQLLVRLFRSRKQFYCASCV